MASSRLRLFSLLLLCSCSDSATNATIDAPLHDGPPGSTSDAPPGSPDSPPGTPTPDASVPPFPNINLTAMSIATGLDKPVAIKVAPGDGRTFVVEQSGRVRIIVDGHPAATPFIDIHTMVSGGSEEGALGLAFHPDYATNGRVFVYWTGDDPDDASDEGTSCHVWEFHRGAGGDTVDGTHKIVLTIPHPGDSNHNGGNIVFGPDGMLYVGIGDGGGSFDSHHNSRTLGSRLAKILRIDVNHGDPYTAPSDNPFFGMQVAGDDTHAANDVWMWGLRNPWRWSFDRTTGDLWIGDVGQNCWEEIDIAPAGTKGLDFGWEKVEGIGHCPVNSCDDTMCTQAGAVAPLLDYDHSHGQAVVGGYVYRGTAIPEIQGMYFFSDELGGFVRSFWAAFPVPYAQTKSWSGLGKSAISTFGEGADGELRYCQVNPAPNGSCWQIVKAASDR